MRKLTIAGFALATALTAGCATTEQAAIDEANATASSAEQTANNALNTANSAASSARTAQQTAEEALAAARAARKLLTKQTSAPSVCSSVPARSKAVS